MLDKFKQLYELQKKAKDIQKELKDTEIEARSDDGTVAVVINGEQHIVDLKIDASALIAENKDNLEKTLIKVLAEAISQAQTMAAEKTKGVMKDLGVNLPGM